MDPTELPHPFLCVRYNGSGCLQPKRGLTRTQPCWDTSLGPLASRTIRSKCLLFRRHSAAWVEDPSPRPGSPTGSHLLAHSQGQCLLDRSATPVEDGEHRTCQQTQPGRAHKKATTSAQHSVLTTALTLEPNPRAQGPLATAEHKRKERAQEARSTVSARGPRDSNHSGASAPHQASSHGDHWGHRGRQGPQERQLQTP